MKEYDVMPLGFTITKADVEEFELDLESDEELTPMCDLSEDGTCESCQ
jgi:hypothetical protein